MTTILGLAFMAAVLGVPVLVVSTCVLLVVTQQPRGLSATTIALAIIAAVAFVTYWFLWGKAFGYADAYRPVPAAIDRASNIAIAVCVLTSLSVVGLGASRLVVAWSANLRFRRDGSTGRRRPVDEETVGRADR